MSGQISWRVPPTEHEVEVTRHRGRGKKRVSYQDVEVVKVPAFASILKSEVVRYCRDNHIPLRKIKMQSTRPGD